MHLKIQSKVQKQLHVQQRTTRLLLSIGCVNYNQNKCNYISLKERNKLGLRVILEGKDGKEEEGEKVFHLMSWEDLLRLFPC